MLFTGLKETGLEEQSIENTRRRYEAEDGPEESDEREADHVAGPQDEPAEKVDKDENEADHVADPEEKPTAEIRYRDETEAEGFEADMNDDLHDDGDGDFPEDDFENGMFDFAKFKDFNRSKNGQVATLTLALIHQWKSNALFTQYPLIYDHLAGNPLLCAARTSPLFDTHSAVF